MVACHISLLGEIVEWKLAFMSWNVLQLPIRQKLSKCFIWALGHYKSFTVHSSKSQSLIGQQRLRCLWNGLAGIKTIPNPTTRSLSVLNLKPRGPFKLISSLLQGNSFILGCCHIGTPIVWWSYLWQCLPHLYPDGDSGRGKVGGQKESYWRANLFICNTGSQWELLNVFFEYQLSLMKRLIYGELGNGKYGCSEFPFLGK